MQRVTGVVQHYAWGDAEFIPRLLDVAPDGRPWAELWFGTHPHGPSRLDDGRTLADLTGPLPYLLKVLAASEPLSMQTHPDAEQARDGHARGVYPDDRAKPELLVALTPFEALCGVRGVGATLDLLDRLGPATTALSRVLATDGPGAAVTGLYRGEIDPAPVVAACRASDLPETAWIRRLDDRYPGDPSVVVALLLNQVHLTPGQGIRLDAGQLHAYLGGVGVELMGASDNVVRAGLTVKPVDVDELLRIADPTPLDDPVLPDTGRYPLPAVDVVLVRVERGRRHTATMHELAVERTGAAWYLAPGDEYVPAADAYVVTR
ncbi:MAG: mannose-6-phosphate isomerase, class I [Acidimicrobiia bacterium]